MPSAAETKVARARIDLLNKDPFFGCLALRLKAIETPGHGTWSTNGIDVRFDPDFVMSCSIEENKGVLCHEVMHCALNHIDGARMQYRDHKIWNDACDYVINAIIKKAGYQLPNPHLYDSRFEGMSVERVYDELIESGHKPNPKTDFGHFEPAPLDEEGKDQTEKIKAEWSIALEEAVIAGKKAGKLPGSFAKLIEANKEPQVNWRAQLEAFFKKIHKGGQSWRRPNNRFVHRGLYLPARVKVPKGELAIFIDTSGSTYFLLEKFAAEMNGILNTVRFKKIYVLDIDTKVQHVQEIEPGDEIDWKRKGFGGTEFSPGFRWIEKNSIRPDAVVYLTDGEGYYPQQPAYPVLWCLGGRARGPTWGETLRIT